MFERYTEKARRGTFLRATKPASLALLILRQNTFYWDFCAKEYKALTNRFLRSHASVESIRKQIEGHTTIREKVSTSVDLPLSNECKRVLAYAAEEAERLSHKHIGTEHLLLGLLREEKCFAAEILHERGLRLSTIRGRVGSYQSGKVPAGTSTRVIAAERVLAGSDSICDGQPARSVGWARRRTRTRSADSLPQNQEQSRRRSENPRWKYCHR